MLAFPLLALVLTSDAGVSLADYDAARHSLDQRRVELAKAWAKDRAKARREARGALLDYLERSAFPAWFGTRWEFYGTTTTPREGAIACGYFVTTVLEQAGFRIERVRLAQQASAYIVSTLARGTKVDWLRNVDSAGAVRNVREHFGNGLYVVGFDLHVGFLRIDGERAAFCHSSYLEPGVVTCEDPLTAGAFVSSLYVVGDVLNDAVLDDWITGRAIESELPRRQGAPRRAPASRDTL